MTENSGIDAIKCWTRAGLEGVETLVKRALSSEFLKASCHDPFAPAPQIIARRKIEMQAYYDTQIPQIKQFFENQNYPVASVLFDYLLKLKKDLIRKDGYTPGYGHEIDQILPLMHRILSGKMDDRNQEILQKHGSLENWFCAILSHDIAEDFGFFPTDIKQGLLHCFEEKGIKPTDNAKKMIEQTISGMEILTHYRKYDVDDFEEITGKSLNLPLIRSGEKVDLRGEYNDFFWDRITEDLPDHAMSRKFMQVYARWNDNKHKSELIVTQYGRCSEDAPIKDTYLSIDWPIYILNVIQHNVYIGSAKGGDRIHGMSSRLSVKNFDLNNYDEYMDNTNALFNVLGFTKILVGYPTPNTPLEAEINSIAAMNKLLHRLANLFVITHPQRQGDKSVAPERFLQSQTDDIGASLLDISEFFVDGYNASLFYEDVPRDSHPIIIFMRQLRDFQGLTEGHKKLYEVMKRALLEEGGQTTRNLLIRQEAPQLPEEDNPALNPN